MKRHCAAVIPALGISPAFQEHLDNGRVTASSCHVQWCLTRCIANVDIRSHTDQVAGRARHFAQCSPMQGGIAVAVREVGIHQHADGPELDTFVLLGRVEESLEHQEPSA